MEETDFHALASELFREFGGMHRRISRIVEYEGRGGEVAVLRALVIAGGTLTPSELADRAWVSNARVANILRALEHKGLVERKHSQNDRRRVNVSLTQAGEAEIQAKQRDFENHAEAFLEQLGEEDTQEMVRLLRRANQIIDKNHERSREQ